MVHLPPVAGPPCESHPCCAAEAALTSTRRSNWIKAKPMLDFIVRSAQICHGSCQLLANLAFCCAAPSSFQSIAQPLSTIMTLPSRKSSILLCCTLIFAVSINHSISSNNPKTVSLVELLNQTRIRLQGKEIPAQKLEDHQHHAKLLSNTGVIQFGSSLR